jgi:hypothetical protein
MKAISGRANRTEKITPEPPGVAEWTRYPLGFPRNGNPNQIKALDSASVIPDLIRGQNDELLEVPYISISKG